MAAMALLLAAFAILASTAAAVPTVTATSYPADLSAAQVASEPHVFNYSGRIVTCESTTFSGELPEPSSSITLIPSYANCHANVLANELPATIDTGGCSYKLTLPEEESEIESYESTAALICPEGKSILARVYAGLPHEEANQVCEYRIKPQEGLESVELSQMAGSPVGLTAKVSISGIATERIKGGALLCGLASGSATYNGNTTVAAESLPSGFPKTISATQVASEPHVFSYSGRLVTCESTTFSGELPEPASSITLVPSFSNCHGQVLGTKLAATVDTGGCAYELSLPEEESEIEGYEATVALSCPEGKAVIVTIYDEYPASHIEANLVCEYRIKPQEGLESVQLSKMAGPPIDLTAKASISGIAAERIKGGALLCGLASGSATYTGNTTVTVESSPTGYPKEVSSTETADHVFTAAGREVTCETATADGFLAEFTSPLTLTPAYSSCHAQILGSKLPATVDTGGCAYELSLPEKESEIEGYESTVGLSCPEGKSMVAKVFASAEAHSKAEAPLCEYKVKPQEGLSGVQLSEAGGSDIAAIAAVSGIAYERTLGTSLNCGSASGNALYTGKSTIATESYIGPIDIWIDP